MRHCIGSELVQIMACYVFVVKPLSKPMLGYCQLDRQKQTSVKFESEFYQFHSRKCYWICRLPEWRPFCLSLNVVTSHMSGGMAGLIATKQINNFRHQIWVGYNRQLPGDLRCWCAVISYRYYCGQLWWHILMFSSLWHCTIWVNKGSDNGLLHDGIKN